MLSGFPNLDCHDPSGYITNLISIACRWPREDVASAIAPGFKFPPTRYEFNKACEREYLARMKRTQVTYVPEPEIDRSNHPTLGELEDQCLKAGFKIGRHKKHSAAPMPKSEACARLGITSEQYDALPDAPWYATCWKLLDAK